LNSPYDPQRFDPHIRVKCNVCGRLERVHFVLASMTSCPCGGVHETLPTAASHVYIVKEETESENDEGPHDTADLDYRETLAHARAMK
jgi:hypothetical protein